MLIQTLKGFRDFLPQEARKRQFVMNTLKQVFESYGFDPLETPALEYEEILTGKYGTEGDKLMYRFADNGGRRVALRYDQTVPLARVVAQYRNELPLPFKRYQIQPVWRAENPQKGRFREFVQCDIDTVGTTSPFSDAELLAIVSDAYESLGFTNFRILVNDRMLFRDLPPKAIIAIDKLKKVGKEAVKEELAALSVDPNILENIMSSSLPDSLQTILDAAKELGIKEERIVFEPTLARGLDYYTGMIIEVEVDGFTAGSVGGGGRYDNLIGMFTGTSIPAVGFAFGFDRILEVMAEKNLFPRDLGGTQVLVSIFSPELLDSSIETVYLLRAKGVNAELYLDPSSKMDKQLKYADKKGIPFVVILGPEECRQKNVTLKNLKTGKQKQISLEKLPDELR